MAVAVGLDHARSRSVATKSGILPGQVEELWSGLDTTRRLSQGSGGPVAAWPTGLPACDQSQGEWLHRGELRGGGVQDIRP